jgi:hypothetical protein
VENLEEGLFGAFFQDVSFLSRTGDDVAAFSGSALE